MNIRRPEREEISQHLRTIRRIVDRKRRQNGIVSRPAQGTQFGDQMFGYFFELDACEGIVGDVDGNGVVNVTDLVAVIISWGPCPQPCESCAPDQNQDCEVDVTDLVIVITNWG